MVEKAAKKKTGAKTQPQHELGETVVENTEVLALLEERETLKEGAASYRTADKAAKGALAGMEAKVPFRIGRFVIDRKPTAARSVSFETAAGVRLSIKADE